MPMNHVEYIQNSMSGKALDAFLSQGAPSDPLVWTKLEICETRKGEVHDSEGMVRFKAYYFLDGTTHCLHEQSQFVKQEGIWLYCEGKIIS
ncbi:hypothetical protein DID77_03330 [Candidatus Marinamargulisbacteria bacterium SCGC AG-439-L15]|nr:hypothetical protein DID77_03330 [Candidatus Marinamargulisbacteria bacterium SCGC AG-439-L15]